MKRLLIVWHSATGGTRQMAEAAAEGAATEPAVDTRLVPARDAGPGDVLRADGYLFATPENLAALTGVMKDFFDRSYYPLLGRCDGKPYALVVCAAAHHPLTQTHRLSPKHFKDVKWILREPGSAMRALSQQALNSLPRGQIVLELGQVEAIKQAVIAGLGIACLPITATADAVACGRLAILDTPFLDLHRRLSLVLHKARYRGALIEAFVKSLDIDSP